MYQVSGDMYQVSGGMYQAEVYNTKDSQGGTRRLDRCFDRTFSLLVRSAGWLGLGRGQVVVLVVVMQVCLAMPEALATNRGTSTHTNHLHQPPGLV